MGRGPSSGRLTLVALIGQMTAMPAGLAQTAPHLLPEIAVPDTRGLRFSADTTVVTATLTILGNAMPNEGGVCFYGGLAVVNGQMTVAVHRVAAAQGRSTLAAFEWAPKLGHGCADAPDLVGAGHSHPYSDCESEQSALPASRADADARLLVSDPRLLFSLIWCFDRGRAVLLWQHGGREVVEYLDLESSTGRPDPCAARSHGGTAD